MELWDYATPSTNLWTGFMISLPHPLKEHLPLECAHWQADFQPSYMFGWQCGAEASEEEQHRPFSAPSHVHTSTFYTYRIHNDSI